MARGEAYTVEALAEWVLQQTTVEGITISGGEPMMQADQLVALLDLVRAKRDLGVVCYTGYTCEQLHSSGTPAQQQLLHRTDLLIDGPYKESAHADLLWRGSANQRLLLLTDRYAGEIARRLQEEDRSAGLQIFMADSGIPWYAGVPAIPGFRQRFEERMLQHGVELVKEDSHEQ
jgi:anaerobic ribonucleoside-triphosphate reductase activating protein